MSSVDALARLACDGCPLVVECCIALSVDPRAVTQAAVRMPEHGDAVSARWTAIAEVCRTLRAHEHLDLAHRVETWGRIG